ncbi:MAG: integrase core domain-containing protein, partial [Sediminibacterium sp.]
FDNLNQVREISDAWIVDYNNHRPHDALGGLPPRVYREKQKQPISIKRKKIIHLMRTQNGEPSLIMKKYCQRSSC